MSKRKFKRNKSLSMESNCFACEHSTYIGEGAYMCSQNNEIIIEEFIIPTEEFYSCHGKEFVSNG